MFVFVSFYVSISFFSLSSHPRSAVEKLMREKQEQEDAEEEAQAATEMGLADSSLNAQVVQVSSRKKVTKTPTQGLRSLIACLCMFLI